MSEKEKNIAKTVAQAFQTLPEPKREYLIGFLEGVAAMTEKKVEDERESA